MVSPTVPTLEEHKQKYSEAIRQARIAGMDSFQAWFNTSESTRQSIVNGYWDFAHFIVTREVFLHLLQPERKTALEIGYGGGRLLNAACEFFREVIGVDIHDEQEIVEALLRKQGRSNFKLITGSGRTIGIPDSSVDFVYSFIVLQHLPSIDVLEDYVKETYRCLRPKGVAQLYFGRYSQVNPLRQIRHLLCGYIEIPTAPVNHVSLVVRVAKMKKLCRDLGFRVLQTGNSVKRRREGGRRVKGGQTFVTLLKE